VPGNIYLILWVYIPLRNLNSNEQRRWRAHQCGVGVGFGASHVSRRKKERTAQRPGRHLRPDPHRGLRSLFGHRHRDGRSRHQQGCQEEAGRAGAGCYHHGADSRCWRGAEPQDGVRAGGTGRGPRRLCADVLLHAAQGLQPASASRHHRGAGRRPDQTVHDARRRPGLPDQLGWRPRRPAQCPRRHLPDEGDDRSQDAHQRSRFRSPVRGVAAGSARRVREFVGGHRPRNGLDPRHRR